MEVLDVLSERLDILVDSVGSHASNLDQTIVLDKYGVTRQITVDNWFLEEYENEKNNILSSHVDDVVTTLKL